MQRTTPRVVLSGLGLLLAFAAAGQEVTLPLKSYEELRQKARVEAPKPAVATAFEEAVLDVEVQPSSARLTQELTVHLDGFGSVKPLAVEIPETGKVLALSGALPPAEFAVDLEVRNR